MLAFTSLTNYLTLQQLSKQLSSTLHHHNYKIDTSVPPLPDKHASPLHTPKSTDKQQ